MPTSLVRDAINGQQALSTPPDALDNGRHTLDIIAPGAAPPSHFVVAREPPLPLWLWTALPLLIIGLLLASVTATMPLLFTYAHTLFSRTPPARLGWRAWLATPGGERFLLFGMLVGVLVFYGVTNDLPTRVIGVALFGLFALVRPDLALLYVPLTVPLFFMPKGIWDDRFGLPEGGRRIPLHEMVLLVVFGATLLRGFVEYARRSQARQRLVAGLRQHAFTRSWWLAAAPIMLFLVAGTAGVLIVPAEGRGAALREWRWLIIEPLMFYALLHYHGMLHRKQRHRTEHSAIEAVAGINEYQRRIITFFVLGGAFVGLLGILQFLGINLVPFVGDKVTFSEDQVVAEGVRRVTSVYGHPNNLGLAMGRIWPLAFVMMLAAVMAQRQRSARLPIGRSRAGWRLPRMIWHMLVAYRTALVFGGCFALAAGGLLVSFSKGAWLGALVATLILGFMLKSRIRIPASQQHWKRISTRLSGFLVGLLLIGVPLVILAGATWGIDIERLNPFGASSSVRLKLWTSSVEMIRAYPVSGIGMDQFLTFYQQGYIHPSLVETNERFTSHPHNVVLDVWLRLGLTGVIVFVWLLVRFFRRVWHKAPGGLLYAGLAAAMIAALVHGMVDNFYFVPDLAFGFWLWLWLADV
jgi:O-antigen ligase